MSSDLDFSNIKSIKVLTRIKLSQVYSINMAKIIIDQKFSNLPMALRFTSKGEFLKLQQESIQDEIENMKLSNRDFLRNLALIFLLQANLSLALL